MGSGQGPPRQPSPPAGTAAARTAKRAVAGQPYGWQAQELPYGWQAREQRQGTVRELIGG